MRILVDPGHGGPFTGACVAGVRESDINLAVSLLLLDELRACGMNAWATRDSDYALHEADRFSDISERARMAGKCGADLLISLHCNNFVSPQVHGLEVWTTEGQNNSDFVAEHLIVALQKAFPEKKLRSDNDDGDRDREKDYNLIKEAPCRAVLVEMGFLSNQPEREWLLDHKNQKRMAAALAEGIFEWTINGDRMP